MPTLTLGVVAGEASGDELAAAIVDELRGRGTELRLVGVGGPALAERGLDSLFDPEEIALVGVTAVLAKLPRLVRLIGRTATALSELEPDVLLVVDAPDFTHRVAGRVRAARPATPIVKLVAPTVWAWRPGRAKALAPIVDEVLAIFPHEPQVMEELGGPRTTFIGHPLVDSIPERPARFMPSDPPHVLVLPGSRTREIERLAAPFGETLALLRKRIGPFRTTVVTPPGREKLVRSRIEGWTVPTELVSDAHGKRAAFEAADLALAASGTVTLELALHGVPGVVAYKLDALERQVARAITSWAIAMPNILADRVVMPEVVNELVRPERMARLLERLAVPSPERNAQLEGFAEVRRRLRTDERPASLAATRILALAKPDGTDR